MIHSSGMPTFAVWHSMNSFRRPGFGVINTPSIFCYIKVSFRTFKISWNMYFPIYLCWTWSHGWHLVDSSIALFPMSVTLPNDYALILSKLLIALMGFPRLGAAFTPRLLMNAPNASCMTCAMHGMGFLKAGHSIREASSVDCCSRVME